MTTAADDRSLEKAFEASLAGRSVPEGAAGLAAFTGAVRGAAAQPGRPNAALAELLSTGLLTDQTSPSTRTAPAAGSSRRTRSRTRRRATVILPALIAKFLSAGAVAQAATGAGVVVVVVTGAGATGVLPQQVQQPFDDLVGVAETEDPTGEVLPPTDGVTDPGAGDGLDPADPTVDLPVTEQPVEVPVEQPVEVPVEEPVEEADGGAVEITYDVWANGPDSAIWESFGAWKTYGKSHGWSTPGVSNSEWAHWKNEQRKKDRAEQGTETPEAPEESGEDEDDDDDTVSVSDASDDRKGKGNGKGNGNGKGKNRD